jgi:hypothetical protein
MQRRIIIASIAGSSIIPIRRSGDDLDEKF